jgi:hypothetical protein
MGLTAHVRVKSRADVAAVSVLLLYRWIRLTPGAEEIGLDYDGFGLRLTSVLGSS